MGASLTERRRVREEGLRVVNLCCRLRMVGREQRSHLTKAGEEATANYVPAAAVRRRWQALFGITGHKARVGG